MEKLKIPLKILANIFAVLILSFVLAFGLKLALGAVWQEPTVAPPGGQPDAPINVGSTAQTKAGNLTILGDFVVNGSNGLTNLSRNDKVNVDDILKFTRNGASYPTIFRMGTDGAMLLQLA